jgi:type I restriction enzyme, S subunit
MKEQTASKAPQIRFKGFQGEWGKKTFEQNIISIQTGTNLLGTASGKGSPLLKMGNIQRGYFSLERLEALDARAEVEAENIAHYGDFLFNTRNTLDLVGKGATWMGESGKFAFNSNLARFKFKGIDTVFFNYLYNTQSLLSQVKARAMGTTSVAAVYPKSLNSLVYKLPQLEEQTQIGGYFRELDRLIELHQCKHDKLVTLKKAMLQKLFPQAGATIPEIRFRGFSKSWDSIEMEKLGQTYSGLFGKTKDDFGRGGGRFVTYMGVFNHAVSNLKMTGVIGVDPSQNEVRKGDVFFTISSETPHEVGMSSVWSEDTESVYLNSFCFGFRPLPSLQSDFLAYVFRAGEFRKRICVLAQGISRYNIAKSKVMNIPVSIPAFEEQEKIGTYFRTLDELISKHATQLQKLKQIKSACLEKMFV